MTAEAWAGGRADPGLELLERALAYTCGSLAEIRPGDLDRPTPCTQWRLADLLAHMEDSLDAFTEGATGTIGLRSAAPTAAATRVAAIQSKARGLMGAWIGARTELVRVGGHPVPVSVISRLAAIEIVVHGWDVGCATGRGRQLSESLAEALLPAAGILIEEQHDEFGTPIVVTAGARADVRLLALTGRRVEA